MNSKRNFSIIFFLLIFGSTPFVFSLIKSGKAPAKFAIKNDVDADKWATEKLEARHRMDDKREDIAKRLAWYNTDVVPAIEYYKTNSRYSFFQINGERSIEEIHKDIIEKIK